MESNDNINNYNNILEVNNNQNELEESEIRSPNEIYKNDDNNNKIVNNDNNNNDAGDNIIDIENDLNENENEGDNESNNRNKNIVEKEEGEAQANFEEENEEDEEENIETPLPYLEQILEY